MVLTVFVSSVVAKPDVIALVDHQEGRGCGGGVLHKSLGLTKQAMHEENGGLVLFGLSFTGFSRDAECGQDVAIFGSGCVLLPVVAGAGHNGSDVVGQGS